MSHSFTVVAFRLRAIKDETSKYGGGVGDP